MVDEKVDDIGPSVDDALDGHGHRCGANEGWKGECRTLRGGVWGRIDRPKGLRGGRSEEDEGSSGEDGKVVHLCDRSRDSGGNGREGVMRKGV